MEKKRVTTYVAGQRFNIVTEMEEKYVLDLCAKVDAHITSLTASSNMSREKAAVLTAMDFADDNEESKRELSAVKEQIKDYLTTIAQHDSETAKLSAKLDQEKSKTAQLQEEIDALKEKLATAKKNVESAEKELRAAKTELEKTKAEATEKTFVQSEAENEDDEILKNDLPFGEIAEKKEVAPIKEEAKPKPEVQRSFERTMPQNQPKPKKNRHDHSHVNPFKEQFLQKNKGYQPQRQYSLFDDDEK